MFDRGEPQEPDTLRVPSCLTTKRAVPAFIANAALELAVPPPVPEPHVNACTSTVQPQLVENLASV